MDKSSLEKEINSVTEIAFSAGYLRALQDVVAKAKFKVTSEVTALALDKMDEKAAAEFIKDHPFKFKS